MLGLNFSHHFFGSDPHQHRQPTMQSDQETASSIDHDTLQLVNNLDAEDPMSCRAQRTA
jgi:hypothetical protein